MGLLQLPRIDSCCQYLLSPRRSRPPKCRICRRPSPVAGHRIPRRARKTLRAHQSFRILPLHGVLEIESAVFFTMRLATVRQAEDCCVSPFVDILGPKIIFHDVQLQMIETTHQFGVEGFRARPARAAVRAQQVKHARRAPKVPTFGVNQHRRDQTC